MLLFGLRFVCYTNIVLSAFILNTTSVKVTEMETLARVFLPVLNLCFMICTGFFIASTLTPKAAIFFKNPTRIKGLLSWGFAGFLVMVLALMLMPYQQQVTQ